MVRILSMALLFFTFLVLPGAFEAGGAGGAEGADVLNSSSPAFGRCPTK